MTDLRSAIEARERALRQVHLNADQHERQEQTVRVLSASVAAREKALRRAALGLNEIVQQRARTPAP